MREAHLQCDSGECIGTASKGAGDKVKENENKNSN